MMDPDHRHHQHQQNQYQHHFQDLQRALQPPPKQHQQQQPTNGLTRYRSAPSSYFATYLDTIDTSNIIISNTSKPDYNQQQQQQQQQPRPLSPETESIIEKFMSSVDGTSTDTLTGSKLCDIPENSPVQAAEFMATVKREEVPPQQQHGNNFSSSPQVIYSPNKPPLAKQNLNSSPVSSNSSVENSSFGGTSSMFMDSINMNKINGSISPASNHVSPFRAHMDSNISQQLKIGVGGTGMTSPGTTGGNVIPSPSPFRVPTGGSVSSPFRALGPVAMDSINQQMKTSGNGLVRHNSLPAGFLANINLDDGFAAMRNLGTNSTNKNSNRSNDSFPSSGRLNGQISLSSGLSSPSSGLDERSFNHVRSTNNSTINNNNNSNSIQENGGGYLTGFPITSWDDSVMLTDNFAGLDDDDDHKAFSDLNSPENQNGEIGNRPPLLAHHLSLPKNAMEKLLHFQDSIPCKTRAKRGMATHPRSIAERVRRTKISERMKKLQDLVPYMDKQTNTADMLDLAVEYIKDLQKQVKLFEDNRAKCSCSG
ncbi:Transcription factor bHLH130-like protein [Drosera capensis]